MAYFYPQISNHCHCIGTNSISTANHLFEMRFTTYVLSVVALASAVLGANLEAADAARRQVQGCAGNPVCSPPNVVVCCKSINVSGHADSDSRSEIGTDDLVYYCACTLYRDPSMSAFHRV
jgi:hypothetical protein